MLGAPQKQNDRPACAVGVAAPAALTCSGGSWQGQLSHCHRQAAHRGHCLPWAKKAVLSRLGTDMGIPQHHSLCSTLPLFPSITGQSDSHIQPKLPCDCSACVWVSLSRCCLLFPRALQALPNLKQICKQDTSHRKGAFHLAEKQIRRIHILQ